MASEVVARIRARYRNGVFEPLEPVDLPEGAEADVILSPDLFTLLEKARANVRASGITEEEWERIVWEACEAARQQSWEEAQRLTGAGG